MNFIGAVGNDDGGKALVDLLEQDKINTSGIDRLESVRTGSAYVTVDDNGENSIVIYGGANQNITNEHVLANRELISTSDYVIAQLETNISSIEKVLKSHEIHPYSQFLIRHLLQSICQKNYPKYGYLNTE